MGTGGAAAGAPLACVMGAIPAEERAAHAALLKYLFATAVRERQELAEGFAFRFGADDVDAVARFIVNERKCCPFLTFELVLMPQAGPVWLRLTGPAGTRTFLEAELPL